MSGVSPSGDNNSFWDIFSPVSADFKEAEKHFHEDLSWKRQTLVVISSIVGGLFFIVGAFPVFRWTVKALVPEQNMTARSIGTLAEKKLNPQKNTVEKKVNLTYDSKLRAIAEKYIDEIEKADGDEEILDRIRVLIYTICFSINPEELDWETAVNYRDYYFMKVFNCLTKAGDRDAKINDFVKTLKSEFQTNPRGVDNVYEHLHEFQA